LQDQALKLIDALDTGFYLTGGTALSRVYLGHRFSDDLDFFLNDHPDFALLADRCLHALGQPAASPSGTWPPRSACPTV